MPLDAVFVVEHGLNVPCASPSCEAADFSAVSFCQEGSGRLPGESNTITVKRCIIYPALADACEVELARAAITISQAATAGRRIWSGSFCCRGRVQDNVHGAPLFGQLASSPSQTSSTHDSVMLRRQTLPSSQQQVANGGRASAASLNSALRMRPAHVIDFGGIMDDKDHSMSSKIQLPVPFGYSCLLEICISQTHIFLACNV